MSVSQHFDGLYVYIGASMSSPRTKMPTQLPQGSIHRRCQSRKTEYLQPQSPSRIVCPWYSSGRRVNQDQNANRLPEQRRHCLPAYSTSCSAVQTPRLLKLINPEYILLNKGDSTRLVGLLGGSSRKIVTGKMSQDPPPNNLFQYGSCNPKGVEIDTATGYGANNRDRMLL